MPAQTKTAKSSASIAVMGIDIGKNVFHLIGLDVTHNTTGAA